MKDNKKKMPKEKSKKLKAFLIAFVVSNVLMLVVLGATYLFQTYLYNQFSTVSTVQILSNPVHLTIAYVVGMLVLLALIYSYETKEDKLSDDINQNHNIY